MVVDVLFVFDLNSGNGGVVSLLILIGVVLDGMSRLLSDSLLVKLILDKDRSSSDPRELSEMLETLELREDKECLLLESLEQEERC